MGTETKYSPLKVTSPIQTTVMWKMVVLVQLMLAVGMLRMSTGTPIEEVEYPYEDDSCEDSSSDEYSATQEDYYSSEEDFSTEMVSGVNRIISGQKAEMGKYTWMAHIMDIGMRIPFCGATLISAEWIVTAAHCMDDNHLRYPESLIVVLGDHDLRTNTETLNRDEFLADMIIMHENYSSITLENDIALIRLKSRVDLKTHKPASLPECGQTFEGEKAVATGWGETEDGSSAHVLQEVDLTITSFEECKESHHQGMIYAGMLCAKGEGNKDACKGDSGGPLTTENDHGQHLLVGVVSWGNGCGQGFPGVYADVAYYRQFIDSIMSKYGKTMK